MNFRSSHLTAAFLAASTLTAACSAPQAQADEIGNASSAENEKSPLQILEEALASDGPAGSGFTDDEAYSVAFAICDRILPATTDAHCEPPQGELLAKLDAAAIEVRIGGGGWYTINVHVEMAEGLDESPRPGEWQVPIFALPNDSQTSPWRAMQDALSEIDSAVTSGKAFVRVSNDHKVTGYRLAFELNSCNGCHEQLDLEIDADGKVVRNTYFDDSSYCC